MCLDCGEPAGESLFLWVSDEIWEKIGCKPYDFLCAHCIIRRLENIHTAAYLVVGSGEHIITGAATRIIMHQNEPKLRKLRDNFYEKRNATVAE